MTAKLTLFVVCCTAFGQMDTSTLRAKYGEPLPQESFQVRPNIVALVKYGPSRQACRIELPPGSYVHLDGEVPPEYISKQQVDEVIDELVPPSERGKEIMKGVMGAGRFSLAYAEYEHVNIAEPQDADHPGRRTSVTITFNRPDCH